MDKLVYSFNEGSKEMTSLLGSKGANLAEMNKIGLPVPYGIIVTTEACRRYYEDGDIVVSDVEDAVFEKIVDLEKIAGKEFGDPSDPLLLSVRSGAKVTMPGMMPTILDLGLNDETVNGLARTFGDSKMAYDCYRRFIRTYSRVVLGIDRSEFDAVLNALLQSRGLSYVVDLDTAGMKDVVQAYKNLVLKKTGQAFPQSTRTQLKNAVKGLFDSWYSDKAMLYRRLHSIPSDMGTAVTIQRMVYGNLGTTSGTGAVFTRSPITGDKKLFGEFLTQAQGEDLVSGLRTPEPIEKMADVFPGIYKSFIKIVDLLEKHYTDMQDVEFTVENGRLYIMQTKSAKRTAVSAVKIAVDMVEEGLISKDTAITRVDPMQIGQLLEKTFVKMEIANIVPLAKGLPSSPGAASGEICFSSFDAQSKVAEGKKVILIRQETSPEDLAGMVVSEGILTERGGMTSHAAMIARGMGKSCISGADIIVNEKEKTMMVSGEIFREGDLLSIDGTTGFVYRGRHRIEQPKLTGDIETIMEWADKVRNIKVRANVDTAKDAVQALQFGAEGVGLCRTERMFLEDDKMPLIAKVLISDSQTERRAVLDELFDCQKEKFIELFRVMKERPVTIRLLDPPFHEFFPQTEEEITALADELGMNREAVKAKIRLRHEFNPMLGERGVRLAVEYPEIAEMQTHAAAEAVIEVQAELGIQIVPEILVPLISMSEEFKYTRRVIDNTMEGVFEKTGKRFRYKVGAMIEVPRAALVADRIAEKADFFSFGTNDLTQMTFGFSRDDTNHLIQEYRRKMIMDFDPFKILDNSGVGRLIKSAAKMGRDTRSNLDLGLCGNHAGSPDTIAFCTKLGFDYVSCSTYTVPAARLSAGQAAVRMKNEME